MDLQPAADTQQRQTDRLEAEVLIVGGGPGGLAAALTLGRLRRSVLICDDGHPRNQAALHMHNFPGFDGVPPAKWREQVKANLQHYPSLAWRADRVQTLEKQELGFVAELASGAQVLAQKIVLAYGIRDQLPEIVGLPALWGKSVVHCPFCHGYEFQQQPLALLADGEFAAHLLPLLRGLSDDVMLFSQGPSRLTPQQRSALAEMQIPLVETPVVALEAEPDKPQQLQALQLQGGQRVIRRALFVAPQFPLQPSSELGDRLGCKRDERGLYSVDPFGQTAVAGVYAVGDISGSSMQSVLHACATGSTAASHICMSLLGSRFPLHA